jgi:integrase
VDYRDSRGRRRWDTKDDKKAAQDRLAEILKGQDSGGTVETRTFEEYGNWWLENCAKGSIKASTYQEYEAVLRKHVYPLLGSVRFMEVRRPMIRELIAAKKTEGYEQSTIRNIMAPVRGMFFQAMEDGITEKNPASRIGKLNKRDRDRPQKKINPLTSREAQTLLKAAEEKKYLSWYPLLLCAPRTGIREGELVSLKGVDVDFHGRFIHVQRNLSRGKISVTKNGKDRKVDMSTQLTKVLSDMLSKRRADALRREMEKPAEERREAATIVNEVMEDWLFQTPRTIPKSEDATPRGGTQIDPSNLRKLFNRLLVDAKMRKVRFHDLRHTFASLLLSQGESPAYVKEQMGHFLHPGHGGYLRASGAGWESSSCRQAGCPGGGRDRGGSEVMRNSGSKMVANDWKADQTTRKLLKDNAPGGI